MGQTVAFEKVTDSPFADKDKCNVETDEKGFKRFKATCSLLNLERRVLDHVDCQSEEFRFDKRKVPSGSMPLKVLCEVEVNRTYHPSYIRLADYDAKFQWYFYVEKFPSKHR